MPLVPSFVALVQPLATAFTAPSFASWLVVVTGWVFAPRRTVTGALCAAGAVRRSRTSQAKHHSAYHRLFSVAQWSLDRVGLSVFGLVEAWTGAQEILVTLDDTLARKRGTKRLFGAGMHHDPLQSSKSKAVMSWGHSWVVLCVAVRFPFAPDRWVSLPILFRLYLNKKAAAKAKRAYRSRPALAVELVATLCAARPTRRFHLVADSAYAGESVLGHLPSNCAMTSRLVLDARIHALAPPRGAGPQSGRPRVRGARLPSPTQMLSQRGRRIRIDLYGRRGERLRVVEAVGCVFKVPGRLLRVVAVQPLTGGRPVQAFFSTVPGDTADAVLTRYAARWSIEEMNKASKQELGFAEPQGWTPKAVERTAPTLMLLYTLVTLWFAKTGCRRWQLVELPWYRSKRLPSFADMLQTLRRESVKHWVLQQAPRGRPCKNPVRLALRAAQLAA